jgi:hypothetical protein
MSAYQGGQKNRNGQTIAVLFYTMSSTSAKMPWVGKMAKINYGFWMPYY